MGEFNTKITVVQLLTYTIVFAKFIHSPRRDYLSPGNSIILEIETALLSHQCHISVTNSCQFWGSFVEILARFQQTCLFSCFTPVIFRFSY